MAKRILEDLRVNTNNEETVSTVKTQAVPNAATKKPVRPNNKKGSFHNAPLVDALLACWQPLVNQLNASNAGSGENEAADSGHQDRASQDAGIRITLGNIIQQLHNQFNGIVPVKGGGTRQIDSLTERVTKAEGDRDAFVNRFVDPQTGEMDYDSVLANARYWRLQAWVDQNQARLDAVGQQLDAYKTVYLHIVREQWKPYVAPTQDAPPVNLTKLSKDIISRNRAQLMALRETKIARA